MNRDPGFMSMNQRVLSESGRRELMEPLSINMEYRFDLRLLSLLREACREDGVFSVIGHAIPSSIYENLQGLFLAFFALSSEEKQRCMTPTSFRPNIQIEYKETASGEMLLINSTPTELYKEIWPTHPIFSSVIAEYLKEHLDLYKSLMTLVRGSLGVAENVPHVSTSSEPITSMTVCYYYLQSPDSPFPKFDAEMLSGVFTMTLLFGSKGLQIFTKGQWLEVKCNTESILVSVGDELRLLTSGEFKRGVHRIVTSDSSRDMLIHVCFSLPKEFTDHLEPFPFGSSDLEQDAILPIPIVSRDLEQDAIVPIYPEPIPMVSGDMEQDAILPIPMVSGDMEQDAILPIPMVSSDLEQDAIVLIYPEPIPMVSSDLEQDAIVPISPGPIPIVSEQDAILQIPMVSSDLEEDDIVPIYPEPIPIVSSDLEEDSTVPIYPEPIPIVSSDLEQDAIVPSPHMSYEFEPDGFMPSELIEYVHAVFFPFFSLVEYVGLEAKLLS